MSSNTLGQYFIELGVKGHENIAAAFKSVKSSMEGLATTFKLTAASLTGLATAGLAGTVEGNRMAFAWQQLSRQIAGVALPAFEAITRVVQRATEWFRSLGKVQQDQLLKWTLLAGVIGGLALAFTGLGTMPGLMMAGASGATLLAMKLGSSADEAKRLGEELTRASRFLGFGAMAVGGAMSLTGIGATAGVPLMLGGTALAMAPEIAGAAGRRLGGGGGGGAGHRDVHPASSGFEAITSSYSRIQASITKTDPVKIAADQLEEIKNARAQIASIIAELRKFGSFFGAGA